MSTPTQTPLIANEWRAIKAGQRLSESIKWPQEAFNIKPENIGWFVKKDDKDATARPVVIDNKGRLFLIQPAEQRIVFKAKVMELMTSGILSTGRIPMEDGVPVIPKELAETTLAQYRKHCEQRKAAAASASSAAAPPTSPQQPVADRQPSTTEATTPHKRKLSESAAVAVTDEPEPKRAKTDSKPAEQKPVSVVSDPTSSMAPDHHAPTAVNTETPALAVTSPPPQAASSSSSVPTKCPSYLPSFTPIFNILYSHMKDPERPIVMASQLAFPSKEEIFNNLEAPLDVYICTCLALSLVSKAKMGHATMPPQHFSGQGIPRYSVWFERNKAYHRKMVAVPMDPFPEDLAAVPCDSYLAAACDAMAIEGDSLYFPFAECASWTDVVNEAYKVANGEDGSQSPLLSRDQVITALESFIDHYLSHKVL